MPCMSYDDRPDYSAREWKNKTDKLARIACKAMEEIGKGPILIVAPSSLLYQWQEELKTHFNKVHDYV